MGYVPAIGEIGDEEQKDPWQAVRDASPNIYGTKTPSVEEQEAAAKALLKATLAKRDDNAFNQLDSNASSSTSARSWPRR
jgi:hypothetical protein